MKLSISTKPSKQETSKIFQKILSAADTNCYQFAQKLSALTGYYIHVNLLYNYRDGTAIADYLVVAMSVLTEGKVKPHEIRPEVFPAPGETLPRLAHVQPTT